MNVSATHDGTMDASWMLVPILLSFLIYASVALVVWPYARPVISVWLLIASLFFPPLFFVVALYVAAQLCVIGPSEVVVVDPSHVVVATPVVVRQGRVRATVMRTGNV